MSASAPDELIPGGLRRPTSVFLVGSNSSLLNWVALALLSPYEPRVHWTSILLPGEVFEPLDPFGRGIIPADRLDIVHPNELRREEQAGRQAEAAAAVVVRSDEPPEFIRRLTDFLRLSSHSQALISATTSGSESPVLALSNVQRLNSLYPNSSIVPTVQAFLDSGASLVLLWAGELPARRKVFDIVLHVEGPDPLHWRETTLWCEQGVSAGPLRVGKRPRLAELPSLVSFLDRLVPATAGR